MGTSQLETVSTGLLRRYQLRIMHIASLITLKVYLHLPLCALHAAFVILQMDAILIALQYQDITLVHLMYAVVS